MVGSDKLRNEIDGIRGPDHYLSLHSFSNEPENPDTKCERAWLQMLSSVSAGLYMEKRYCKRGRKTFQGLV